MKLNSAIETILNKRGISAADDVAEFLSDKPSLTYDPFMLKDMYEGVDLIMMAVETGKSVSTETMMRMELHRCHS